VHSVCSGSAVELEFCSGSVAVEWRWVHVVRLLAGGRSRNPPMGMSSFVVPPCAAPTVDAAGGNTQ
jgi:hypothetical protein